MNAADGPVLIAQQEGLPADAESRGDISIRFYSADDLHRLLELLLNRSLDDA